MRVGGWGLAAIPLVEGVRHSERPFEGNGRGQDETVLVGHRGDRGSTANAGEGRMD